jgi:hypothetical protein
MSETLTHQYEAVSECCEALPVGLELVERETSKGTFIIGTCQICRERTPFVYVPIVEEIDSEISGGNNGTT